MSHADYVTCRQSAVNLPAIRGKAADIGLVLRGAFHPGPADMVPDSPDGRQPATVVLLGFTGQAGWDSFRNSDEAHDGRANPLDRWSQRVIGDLAADLAGVALFPFGGPPFLPFQRWALRAEPVSPSPLGILIHPAWGLWHSYRGAVALQHRVELPPLEQEPSPCVACAERPCLSACPVGAFTAGAYDVAGCRGHLKELPLGGCMSTGCLARLACPVGREYQYSPHQAAFHMRSFAQSVGALPDPP